MLNNHAKEARLAAMDPTRSAWVPANAGAGKTTLLVGRVLRLLLSCVPPERILCVTYTKAAAAEMISRIRDKAMEWAVAEEAALITSLTKLTGFAPPEALKREARMLFVRLLEAEEGVRIQTIHAFCQSILKRFPLESGVPPHFSVLDERTADELLKEAMQHLYTQPGEGLGALAAVLSEGSLAALLREMARNRRRLRALMGNEAMAGALLKRALSTEEAPRLETVPLEWLRGCIAPLEAAGGKVNGHMAQALARWVEEGEVDAYARAFLTQAGAPRKQLFTAKAQLTGTQKEILLRQQEAAMAYVQACNALRIAEVSERLLGVAGALLAAYERLKRERAWMDYDDLILAATRLLGAPGAGAWVMYKLDGGIDHLLIDEAQDTSREQWDIVQALTGEFYAGQGRSEEERTLFVVGDVKQSIFRFQGAEPRMFEAMRGEFRAKAQAAGMEWVEAPLPESFRSTQAVLELVDAVQGDTQHVLIRAGLAGSVELWPLVKEEGEAAPEWALPVAQQTLAHSDERLAALIAQRVAEWLAGGERLESEGRAMQPGDILVLVRRRTEFVDALIRAFKRRGVPVAGVDRMRLTENLAVKDVLALIAFLLLPEDDLSLACVLKSPLVGVDEEKLFALAWGREGSLWRRMQGSAEAAWLSGLLAQADFLPPYELLMQVLARGRARLTGRMGEEYHDALDELLAQALLFEQAHTPSLQGFAHWLDSGSAEVKRDMEQARGEVRIMTVHGAKGLEAPVVILPDTAGAVRQSDRLLWHEEEGHGLPLWPQGEDAPLTARLREERKAEDEAEHKRLLYVALTRAKERLVVCGWEGRKAAPEGCWHNSVRQAMERLGAHEVATPAGAGLRYAVAQTKAVEEGRQDGEWRADSAPLPAWLGAAPPMETGTELLSPSHLADYAPLPHPSPLNNAVYQRGTLTHRLLQYLPSVAEDKRTEALAAWMTRFAPELPESERADWAREVEAVLGLPAMQTLLGAGSLAEAPVAGILEYRGKRVRMAGQIDRLAVLADSVWIADYKTHQRPPASAEAVPLVYLRQMAAYRALLAQIYPDKRIRCALVWTAAPVFMELPEKVLEGVLEG